MDEIVLNRMLELLDIQQGHCVKAGATVALNSLERPKGGSKSQNSYYDGHLNMAQAIAWEIHKDIVKENGKHKLVDERSVNA